MSNQLGVLVTRTVLQTLHPRSYPQPPPLTTSRASSTPQLLSTQTRLVICAPALQEVHIPGLRLRRVKGVPFARYGLCKCIYALLSRFRINHCHPDGTPTYLAVVRQELVAFVV